MKSRPPRYRVQRAPTDELPKLPWNAKAWKRAPVISIAHIRPESSSHRPPTQARLLYDDSALYCIFRVEDRYVRSRRMGYQSHVWKDSCVELFLRPGRQRSYFNFEFNCGGALRCSHIEWGKGGEDIHLIPRRIGKRIQIVSSLPGLTPVEIRRKKVWTLASSIPFSVLEEYAGELGELKGQVWRANLYKCADECSHPHWMSWSPVSALNFHAPWDFGFLEFQ